MLKLGTMLAAVTTAVHIFIGTADTLNPMLAAGLAPAVAGTLHACWHVLSLILLYSTAMFWRADPAARHFAVIWLGGAVIFAAVGLWQQGVMGLIVLPQWTLLAATGIVVLLGLARTRAENARPTP